MTTISQGSSANINIAVGDTVQVTTPGSALVKFISGTPDAGFSSVRIAAETKTFGGYGLNAVINVTAIESDVTYQAAPKEVVQVMVTSTEAPSDSDGREDGAIWIRTGYGQYVKENGTYKIAGLQALPLAVSDETTALTTGTAKITFRMPFAMELSEVRASLTTAQASGSVLTVDVNEGGTSILSTKLTIDNTEKTSKTAAAAAVISDTLLADDAEITVDIDQVGNGTAKGLKLYLIGRAR